MSEMLSNEPGSVSYSKLVRLDVVRCPRLNRQGVTESRAKENGSEGGKRMTLIELSIKMSKNAPAETCTLHTGWKKCCIFQDEKNKDLTQRPTNSHQFSLYCWYTIIATNMQYFSLCPRGLLFWIIQGLTKAEKALRRKNALAPDRCTK